MDNLARFACRFNDCNYTTSNFNQLLNHCCNKHSLDAGFAYKCDVSSCTNKFTHIQSLRRHHESKNLWFHEGKAENENADLDENSENENEIPMLLNESSVNSEENNELDCEIMSFSNSDHKKLVANLFKRNLWDNYRGFLFR